MSKFKVGDKVRRIENERGDDYKALPGDIVTVSEVCDIFIAIKEDGVEKFWFADYFELIESYQKPTQPKLRWLQVEYVKNTDHPMSGLNKHVTAPVLQYWDGSDWQTVETVLETHYESV